MSHPYKATFFVKYPEYIPPTSEEDAQVDPKEKLIPPCEEKCKKFTKLYDECAERVKKRNALIRAGKSELESGHCMGQHYDLVDCVNTCVAKDLFRYLK